MSWINANRSENNPQYPREGMVTRIFSKDAPTVDPTVSGKDVFKVYDMIRKRRMSLTVWNSTTREIADLFDEKSPEEFIDCHWVKGEEGYIHPIKNSELTK